MPAGAFRAYAGEPAGATRAAIAAPLSILPPAATAEVAAITGSLAPKTSRRRKIDHKHAKAVRPVVPAPLNILSPVALMPAPAEPATVVAAPAMPEPAADSDHTSAAPATVPAHDPGEKADNLENPLDRPATRPAAISAPAPAPPSPPSSPAAEDNPLDRPAQRPAAQPAKAEAPAAPSPQNADEAYENPLDRPAMRSDATRQAAAAPDAAAAEAAEENPLDRPAVRSSVASAPVDAEENPLDRPAVRPADEEAAVAPAPEASAPEAAPPQEEAAFPDDIVLTGGDPVDPLDQTASVRAKSRSTQPPKPAKPAGQPLQLEVFLNGETVKMVGAFIRRDDGHLLSTAAELKSLGIRPTDDAKDEDYIELDTLSGFTYTYDEPRQRLDGNIEVDRRMPNEFDGRGTVEKVERTKSSWGAALNYLVFATSERDDERREFSFSGASAQLEGRLFTPYGHFQQTGFLGKSPGQDSSIVRLDSTFEFAHADKAVIYRAGDVVASGPSWSRAMRLGGLQASRDYGMRPDLVTLPLPVISGTAQVPSTIDIFVNNVKTYTNNLPVGPYNIANVPGITGAGNAIVVLRDQSGREISQALPFFTSPSLLAPGLLDFQAQIGFPRFGYGSDAFSYGPWPLAIASGRYGISKNFTAEGHLEAGAGLINSGAGMVTNFGALGVLSLASRTSLFDGVLGHMLHGSFETKLGPLSLSLGSQRTVGRFEDLVSVTARMNNHPYDITRLRIEDLKFDAAGFLDKGAALASRVPKAMDRITIGIPVTALQGSLGLSFVNLKTAQSERSRILNATWSQMIGEAGSLTISAFTDLEKPGSAGIFAGYSTPIGRGFQGSVGMSSNRQGSYGTAEIDKPLGREVGDWGLKLRDTEGREASTRTLVASYRSNLARLEGTVEQATGRSRASFEAEGGIVLTTGGIAMGQRVQQSFAVVDTGAPNVPVLHDNRSVGKSDWQGLVLVPDLVPHQKNRISIDTLDLPVGAQIGNTNEVVVPNTHAGLRVDFKVDTDARAVIFTLHDAAGKPLQAGLQGKLVETGENFVVGYDGQAYLDNARDKNTVKVDLLGTECIATFELNKSEAGIPTIGPFVCQ